MSFSSSVVGSSGAQRQAWIWQHIKRVLVRGRVVKEGLVGARLSRIRGFGSCVEIVEILVGVGRDDGPGLACLSGHKGSDMQVYVDFSFGENLYRTSNNVPIYTFLPLFVPLFR